MDIRNQPKDNSCWNCFFHNNHGTEFLGKCLYFEEVLKTKAKDIPKDVVDNGCGYFKKKQGELF